MRNLVDRLRDHRELLGYDEPLLMEAAAEVERLTKRDEVNAKLRADQDDLIARLTADLAVDPTGKADRKPRKGATA